MEKKALPLSYMAETYLKFGQLSKDFQPLQQASNSRQHALA